MGPLDLRRPAPLRRPRCCYELPFGQGKPLAQTGVPAALLGGWQISAIVNKSSGFPRDPQVGTDIPNTGAQTYRPNLVAGQDPNDGAGTVQQWFNTAAFARPDAFTYGNAGRNIVIGPGIFDTDMSLIRNFRLAGRDHYRFRLEAFNVFNNPISAIRTCRWQVRSAHHQQHEIADARATARSRIRVLEIRRPTPDSRTPMTPIRIRPFDWEWELGAPGRLRIGRWE